MIITADDTDELRDLGEFLVETEELRGRVNPRLRPPEPGTMGPVIEALDLLLAPGGITAATATAIIAWLRTRRANVRLRIRNAANQSIELDASGVTGLDAQQLKKLTTTMLETLNTDQQDPPHSHP